MAQNLRNFGVVEGRLGADPKIFENKDGSKKVLITVYVDDNFVTKSTGKRESQRLQLEDFVSNKAQGLGIYERIYQGSQVAIGYHLVADAYEKNGETVYAQKAVIDVVEFRESRTESQARQAQRAASATNED